MAHLDLNAQILKALKRLNEFEDNAFANSIELLKHGDKRALPNTLTEAGFQNEANKRALYRSSELTNQRLSPNAPI